jgi:hypothetical protein
VEDDMGKKKKKAKKGEAAADPIEDGEFQAGANGDRDEAASAVEPGVAVNVLSDTDVRSD